MLFMMLSLYNMGCGYCVVISEQFGLPCMHLCDLFLVRVEEGFLFFLGVFCVMLKPIVCVLIISNDVDSNVWYYRVSPSRSFSFSHQAKAADLTTRSALSLDCSTVQALARSTASTRTSISSGV